VEYDYDPNECAKFNTHLRLRQKTCRLHSASKLCRGKGSFDLVCIRFVFDLFGVGVSNKSIQISLLQPPHAHSARLPDCASLNLLPTSYMWNSIVLTNWMPWTFCFGRSGSSLQMFREKIVLWHLQWVSTVALPPDAFWQEIKVCFDIIRSDMDARAVLLSGLGTVNSATNRPLSCYSVDKHSVQAALLESQEALNFRLSNYTLTTYTAFMISMVSCESTTA